VSGLHPAIGLLEFSSIARGVEAGDAMVKRAPVEAIYAGTVHPGKFLVLVGGLTASVEEAMDAGLLKGADAVLAELLLPDVHPAVVTALRGVRVPSAAEAVGVVETTNVAAAIAAADAAMKAAAVELLELRLADDIGGKGYAVVGGEVGDVAAAIAAAAAAVAEAHLVSTVVIPQAHEELMANLDLDPRFGYRTRL
jgi:microcompartment protein CcmL/EutN